MENADWKVLLASLKEHTVFKKRSLAQVKVDPIPALRLTMNDQFIYAVMCAAIRFTLLETALCLSM